MATSNGRTSIARKEIRTIIQSVPYESMVHARSGDDPGTIWPIDYDREWQAALDELGTFEVLFMTRTILDGKYVRVAEVLVTIEEEPLGRFGKIPRR